MTTDLEHAGIAGLSPIAVGDHHRQASQKFRGLAKNLRTALAESAIDTAHIGGTAVAGLTGRAVVDVMLIVADLYAFDQSSQVINTLGYRSCGDGGISGQRLYRLGQGFNFNAELYVYEAGDRTALQHLLVRDYLRANKEQTQQFAELKSKLADRHMTNSAAYAAGKRPRLRRLLDMATARG